MKHGGDLTDAIAQFGGAAESWLDLSTGINPWPWPVPEIPAPAWQRLPARADQHTLIEIARLTYGVPDDSGIAPAAGSQALIQILPYLMQPGPVAIAEPTYREHAASFARAGHEILSSAVPGALPDGAVNAVIVNPNNPDGRIVGKDVIARIAHGLDGRGGWLVIDEAFADVEPSCSAVELCGALPIVVLRSFGKFYGLAGIRLGFGIARHDIVARIAEALGPWPVSGPALVTARTALSDRRWAEQTREKLREQARRLDAVLLAAKLEIVGGTTLFRLARHSDASVIHKRLAQNHVWVRRFDHADDLLRFGIPVNDDAFTRLAAALRATG